MEIRLKEEPSAQTGDQLERIEAYLLERDRLAYLEYRRVHQRQFSDVVAEMNARLASYQAWTDTGDALAIVKDLRTQD